MATIQVIEEGPRNLVLHVTGTGGDAGVSLVDVSALNPSCTRVRLMRATYDVSGTDAVVTLLWDATVDVPFLYMSTGSGQTMCFKKIGGIPNSEAAGATGDVLITSTASTNYAVTLHFVKGGEVNSQLL